MRKLNLPGGTQTSDFFKAEEIIQAYMRVERNSNGSARKINRSKKHSVHVMLNSPVDPYITDTIVYENTRLRLNRKLESAVEFDKDEGVFLIKNELLNITVWGQTRQEAEDAFQFMFVNLYTTIAREDDSQLTEQAIHMKENLLSLINNISDNENQEDQ